MNRRTVLKSGAGATVATAMGVGWLILESDRAEARASLQQGVTAGDVSVTSNNGELNTLTLSPSLTIEWSNFPEAVDAVEIHITIGTGGNITETVYSAGHSGFTTSKDGSSSKEITGVNTLKKNRSGSVGLDSSTFADPTEGDGPKETDVGVQVMIDFLNEDRNPIPFRFGGRSDIAVISGFTVAVTNQAASASVTGTLNTTGS